MIKTFYFYIVLIISILFFNSITNAITTLKINGSIIQLNSPIIKHNNHYYLPLRDSLTELQGTLTKSRKYNAYSMSIPRYNITATFKSRRKDFSVNGTRHYLPVPILLRDSRIHVPIPEFFTYLGFKVFVKPPIISVIPKKNSSFQTKTHSSPSLLNKHDSLPMMEKDRPLYIAYANQKANLSTDFFYKNGVLFANILPFFKKINYTFEKTATGFLLSKKHHTIQFFINQNNAISQFINHQNKIFLAASPLQKNNTYYLPLESTLNAFFYAFEWNSQTRTIHLLSIINDIDFIKEQDRDVLQINSTHPITFEQLETHPWSPGYTFTISDSKILLKERTKKLSDSILAKYSAKQLSATSTQIKIIGNTHYKRPYIKSNNLGIEINFLSTLANFSETRPGVFNLRASGSVSPKLTHLPKQKKIILDIPYAYTSLDRSIDARYTGITKIRTSQFTINPPQSRIVFDLKKTNVVARMKQTNTGLTLSFKEKKIVTKTPPKKTQKKRYSKRSQIIKKSNYTQSSSLKGKIIVIDAGHGGKDPGAVSLKRYQEKIFTLDIAKRLQKKLARQGAVVIMTRQNDRYRSLQARAYIANKNKADIFISVHVNSFLKSSVHGTETFYYKYKDRKLATHLQKQLIKDLKSKNLKTKRARLYVLRHTQMPAALIEPLFLTNPKERKKVIYPQYRQKIANSIYQGISNYFKYN